MRHNRRFNLAALLLLPVIAACGTGDGGGNTEAAIEDPIQYDASSKTRAELGIERWGMAQNGDERQVETIVRGYGPRNERLVEFRHLITTPDDAHRSVAISVSGTHGEAAMRFDVEARATADVEETELTTVATENTFMSPAAGKAERVLDRARADGEESQGSGGVSLVAKATSSSPASIKFQQSGKIINDDKGAAELVKTSCKLINDACRVDLLAVRKSAQELTTECRAVETMSTTRLVCGLGVGGVFDAECGKLNEHKEACAKAVASAVAWAKHNKEYACAGLPLCDGKSK